MAVVVRIFFSPRIGDAAVRDSGPLAWDAVVCPRGAVVAYAGAVDVQDVGVDARVLEQALLVEP